MKKVKAIFFTGAIIIISLCIFNIYNLNKLNKQSVFTKKLLSSCSYKIKSDSITIKSIGKNLLLISKNNGFKVDPNMLMENELGETIKLSDIQINHNYLLVFRFNEFSCHDCVYNEMGNIQRISKLIGKENILILGAYNNRRYLYLNKRINNLKLPVFNVPMKSIDNEIDCKNIPYIFTIDREYNAKNLFIPSKDYPLLSDKYYNKIIINLYNE